MTEVSLYIIQVIYTERHIRTTMNDTLSYIEHLTSYHVSHFGFDYVPQEQFGSEALGDEMKEKKIMPSMWISLRIPKSFAKHLQFHLGRN